MTIFWVVELLEKCLANDFSFDVFRDSSGSLGLAVFVGEEFYFFPKEDEGFHDVVGQVMQSPTKKACFDCRKLGDLGLDVSNVYNLYDLRCLFSWDGSLFQLVKDKLGDSISEELKERDQRFASHIRACRTAQVDLKKNSILRVVPSTFVQSLLKIRTVVMFRLLSYALENNLEYRYLDGAFPFYRAMMEVERSKIKVFLPYVDLQLFVPEDLPPHLLKWFRGAKNMAADGFLRTRFSPVTTKTGRLRCDGRENSFNCMGIPHGSPRQALVSRFEGGRIGVIDYNAIDYRCIVESVDDLEFKRRYEKHDDFHKANCEVLFGTPDVSPEVRNAVKQLTYISIYGGSLETLSEKTGLSLKNVASSLDLLNRALKPVHDFREKLYEKAVRNGYVYTHGQRRVPLESDDHPGKVLGLYAQGYSSHVFEQAVITIVEDIRHRQSKLIFTVHDEVVLDLHPDELGLLAEVKSKMEGVAPWLKAEAREGVSYGACTD